MHTARPARFILVIAGSDPSGGAGIQADLRVLALLRAPATAALTCVTVQNSQGVTGINPLPPALVAAQIRAAMTDLDISHVKIGMVGNEEIAQAIAQALQDFQGQVVYDPVLAASAGQQLFRDDDGIAGLYPLLSRTTVASPNSRELVLLSGMPCDNHLQARRAAGCLLERFPRLEAVVITGGHLGKPGSRVTDLLVTAAEGADGPQLLTASHRRVATSNDRGTGCSFASAYAAFHQQSGSHQLAFIRAGRLVGRLLRESARHGSKGLSGPMLLPRLRGGG